MVNDSEDVDGLHDAGVALLRAYNYVAQEVDHNYAFQTVISVSIPLPKQCNYICMWYRNIRGTVILSADIVHGVCVCRMIVFLRVKALKL